MDTDESLRPVFVPVSEWEEDDQVVGSWSGGSGWKGSDNADWNESEYGGCGSGCDDAPLPPLTSYVPVGGSASKWKPGEFEDVLASLPHTFSQEGATGLIDGDDSVVMRVNDNQAIVFSIDWFTPVVDDYYQFGAISAASALSGLYAAGVAPITALNVMALPCKMGVETVGEVIRGGSDKVIEAGAFVVGGHSIDDDTPKYGLATFGLAPADAVIHNERVAPGDVLFYTKPVGSGIVAQAYREGKETAEGMQGVVDAMLELNKAAADAMSGLDVHGATRVAEGGLVGHLHALLETCGHAARLDWDAIPLFDRVLQHATGGIVPDRGRETAAWAREFVSCENVDEAEVFLRLSVLCDPQTSGGLLVVVAECNASAYAAAFEAATGRAPARIGVVQAGKPGAIAVV